jgi:Zn-finger nucleic acid-binding protein/ribosomal protein L40E
VSTESAGMGAYLVACSSCRAQFDPTGIAAESFLCHCGARVTTARPKAVDAPVRRCSACGAGVEPGAEKCTYCGSITTGTGGRLVCPECYARNPGAAQFCSGCGIAFRPEPAVTAGDAVPCPVCASPLTPRSLAGLAVQECATCWGLWVPTVNFDTLVKRAGERRQARPTDGLATRDTARPALSARVAYRSCPVCRQMMHRKNFSRISGVIVDWCRAHGTWLDANELEQIASFVVAGGMERVAAQERDEAKLAASIETLRRIPQTPQAQYEQPQSGGLVDLLIGILS